MLPGHASPPLTLPPDEMRRLGYQVIDLIVDALSGLRERPPSHRATPAELAGVLHEPVPAAGADPEEVLRQAVHDVLAPAMRVDHPRFFAYVPIPSNYVGVLADLLSSGFGIFAGTWQAASGAAAAALAPTPPTRRTPRSPGPCACSASSRPNCGPCRLTVRTGCGRPTWRRRSRPTGPPAGGRSA